MTARKEPQRKLNNGIVIEERQSILIEKHPYSNSECSELIVRDYLAIDRTTLANERTFLVYMRTAVTLCLGGVSLIKFVDILIVQLIGWFFIPVGISTFVIGILKYRKMAKILAKVTTDNIKNVEETESPEDQ